MARRPRGIVALTALLLATGAGRGARADESSQNAAAAEALFREARALLAEGKVEEACPKLAASERLDPGYGTLYNLADCQEKLGHTASAWASYVEAAEMAKRAGQAERVEKAQRRAAELEPKLTRIQIMVPNHVAGLAVKRGETTLDASMWGVPLPVDPGALVIEATAPGKKKVRIEAVTKGPGQTATIRVPPLVDDLAAAPPPGPSASVARPSSVSWRSIAGFVAGGVGLAGLVVGAATGLTAKARWDDAQRSHCQTPDLCDAAGVSLVSTAETMATASTVGFVAGGVLLAGGVVLVATAPPRSIPPPAGTVSGLSVAPSVGPGSYGITLRGGF